jgi:hypothetical protein
MKQSSTGQRSHVFKLFYVSPSLYTPLLLYRWCGEPNFDDAELSPGTDTDYEKHSFVGDGAIPCDEIKTPPEIDYSGAAVLTRSKVAKGWVGRPLLEFEYPDHPGAYSAMEKVEPILCPFVSAVHFRPESKLLELIHSIEDSSDASWACRASLPMNEASLIKLKPLADQYDVRRMMHVLDSSNPAKLSYRELETIREQLYEKICSVFNDEMHGTNNVYL